MSDLKTKYSKSPIKADLYSLDQLKIALDDLLIEYCSSIGHKEIHLLTDIQNIVGVVSIILCLCVLGQSYYFKFDTIRSYMALCLLAYFALNILAFILTFFMGGKISFEKLNVKTSIDSAHQYQVTLNYKSEKSPVTYKKSIFELFDNSSKLDHEIFLNDVADLFKIKSE